MKIAFTGIRSVPANYGGFETAAEEIGVRLVERGHTVIAYCRRTPDVRPDDNYKGIRKIHAPLIRLRVGETLSHTLFSMLHMLFSRPDVAIVFNPANGPLCLLLKLARIPFAINVDGLEWRRTKWSRVGRKYLYFAAWASARLAPRLIADSRGIQAVYQRHFNRSSDFIPYGGKIETSSRPGLLAEEGLERGDYFLVVARLEPENNTDLIIEAFSKVQTDKKLVIVGGVPYPSAYVDRLHQTPDPRVRFLGPIYNQPKLTELLCNSYAYLHGHEVGGTNPILVRALGCGSCVLYLDNEFNREVAENAGRPAAKDVASITQGLQELVDEPAKAESLRTRGPNRIRSHYSWDSVTDGYEKLCRQLSRRR